MRQKPGGRLLVFNGRDGEWIAEVAALGRGSGVLVAREPGQAQRMPPDVWLMFAPIRKARTDFIVEKATELGAARILPVLTREFTNAERLGTDRLRAHAIEAAEQCGGTFVPEVAEPERLAAVLDRWEPARRILLCDERLDAPPVLKALAGAQAGPWAMLTGPEGGFAAEEAARLRAMAGVMAVSTRTRVSCGPTPRRWRRWPSGRR